jgi:hypothetical protein
LLGARLGAARRLEIEVVVSPPVVHTPLKRGGKNRLGSRVVHADDIHTPVENPGNQPRNRQESPQSGRKPPPGQFVSNELEEQTARFIEEVKGLALRRRKLEAEEKGGPPPKPDQRSRRR